MIARKNHFHKHAMIVRLVFEMGSNSSAFLSLHQGICLKHVRTLEHGVLSGVEFPCHVESELVPITFCKLMRWSFFIVSPGLFRTCTTENTNNEV